MTESFWMKRNTKTTNYPTLQKETDAHIAIIGGGLTGITTAIISHRQRRMPFFSKLILYALVPAEEIPES